MRLRNTILQFQFFQRLNASEDRTPARTYWLRNRNTSLALRFSKENAIHMMNNNLSQLSQKDKRDIIVCELEARSRGMNNVGSSITFDTNLNLRACFQAGVLTNRNSRIRKHIYQITGGQQVESLMKVQQNQKKSFE